MNQPEGSGIPVENHKSFLDLGEYEIATQVEELLKNCINPVEATLPNGGVVLTPSSEFNTLFVAYHNAMHYGSGFSLHHLVDWACVIRKYGLNLPKELKDKHFLRGIAAMTQLSNKYLGTNVPIKGGEKLAAEMLEEIFHPINDRIMPEGNVFKHYLCRAKRFFDMTHIKNSILFNNVYIASSGTVSGKKEHDGPLGKYIDKYYEDSYAGCDSWEKSEQKMLHEAVKIALSKEGITEHSIDLYVGGDLNNQLACTNYMLKNYSFPYFGVYAACSTLTLSLIIGSSLLDSNYGNYILASASSHNATSERQFRYPTEYGGQKPSSLTSPYTKLILFLNLFNLL